MKYLACLCYIALSPLGVCLIALAVLVTPQDQANLTIPFRTSESIDKGRLEVALILMKNRTLTSHPHSFVSRQDYANLIDSRYEIIHLRELN